MYSMYMYVIIYISFWKFQVTQFGNFSHTIYYAPYDNHILIHGQMVFI
jgi:hypothetical protein